MALVERSLFQLRRAGARYAGVVRTPVVRIARYAGSGTQARHAERPLWAA